MDISAALAADLVLLSQALEDADLDLETRLRGFAATVHRAVSSYTGMTMTIVLDGYDISFTVHDDAKARPVTSLLIPLAALTPATAADLSYALGIDPAALVLDGQVDSPADSVAGHGLEQHLAINQAIGILIGRGYTPESARNELHRLAAMDHGNLRSTAEAIIRSARSAPTD